MVNSIVLSAMSWASSLKNAVVSAITPEDGQDLIEYSLLIGFIAVAAAVAFLAAPVDFGTFAQKVADCVSFNTDACGG